ncbi:hypothetical protein [Chondrinema litorale]|uniref:hypothetical protein n=1 Tax=Chondrinema litorale TaxID=2994555 RepID=UPI0025434A78|nr:hypothetical protein [Chondrinema litorale]UZR94826.1 hypothetical protein OQ292_03230 [Chondrinema litorale]
MYDLKAEERKARNIGMVTGVIIFALFIVFLMNMVVWRPSIEPITDYGMEINFGTDDFGSGDAQSKAPANLNESLDEAKPTPETIQPVTENTQNTQEVEPVQESNESVDNTEVPNQTVAVTDAQVDESVEAVPEEKVKKEEVKEKAEEKKVEEKKKEANPATLLGGEGTADENKKNSNGNTTGTGDQGKQNGSLNSDALLGGGGSGGSSLDMPGWQWESAPKVVDNSSMTGKLVFEVKIDDEGEVISAERVYSDIADRNVINSYKNAIMDLIFEQESDMIDPPRITTGRITFIITAR